MKSTRNWLDNLKVRASVGSLGNGNVSPYLYLSTIPIKKTSVILGDALQTYATTPNIVPNSLTGRNRQLMILVWMSICYLTVCRWCSTTINAIQRICIQ